MKFKPNAKTKGPNYNYNDRHRMHIIMISRFGSKSKDIRLVTLTKGEEKQIDDGVLNLADIVEDSLDLGSGDSWSEIEVNNQNISTFTELLFLLKSIEDNKDYSILTVKRRE